MGEIPADTGLLVIGIHRRRGEIGTAGRKARALLHPAPDRLDAPVALGQMTELLVGHLLQSGNVRNYAAAIGVGVVLLLSWFVVVRGLL